MVRRYDLEDVGWYKQDLVERPDGYYVEYTDLERIEKQRDQLRFALQRIVDCTEAWNESVRRIIGRQPQTGIDLIEAKKVLEFTR